MKRIDRSNLRIVAGLLLALAGIFVACAEGGDGTALSPEELDSDADADAGQTPSKDGGGVLPPDSCNGACTSEQVCRDSVCVDLNPDEDKDGYRRDVDCDDTDPNIHPGAKEICNGKDDDCNGKIDDGLDQDKDGFTSCVDPDAGVDGLPGGDCDDTNADIHPGAQEICNGKDDDCNGKIDDIPALLNGSLAAPVDTHWKVKGHASILSDGWAELTPSAKSRAGALWWGAVYTFDTFDVTAKFRVNAAPPGGADGLTFAWVEGASVPGVGSNGSGYGVEGLVGYAVLLDMYGSKSYKPTVSVIKMNFEDLFGVPVPTMTYAAGSAKQVLGLNDGNEHTLRVRLEGGKITVGIDGTNHFNNATISGYKPFAGHWGFTAGTGAEFEGHYVKDVTMSFPDGQGCVK